MKKIIIISPYFTCGGGDSLTAWTIQALRNEYEISLLTYYKPFVSDFNKIYGTNLLPKDIKVINPPLSHFLKIIPGLGMLKYHFLIRFFKNQKEKYDIIFGTYKEIDFGSRGIQYIHFPELYENDKDLSLLAHYYYKYSSLRLWYRKICYAISGFDEKMMKSNISLTNSDWTKKKIKEIMDVDAQVVYPPVFDDFAGVEWSKKENGFVCIGRICPEKRTKLVIKIIGLVRAMGFNVHLHIIGPIGDKQYYNDIKRFQKDNKWIFLDGMVERKVLSSMISQHKYGIHGRKDEHFGISVVEMIKGGCVAFIPDNGGQVEIINDPRLTYNNEEDAAKKIRDVLKNEDLQRSLQDHLAKRAGIFSIDKFTASIKEITKEFLEEKSKHGVK